jgi:hypothetical protein
VTRIAGAIGVSAAVLVAGLSTCPAQAQSNAARTISGAWVPMGAGRGAVDPKIAPPPATPIVLKAPYAAAYDARRTSEAEATKKGQPPATPAVLCLPYGMPRMMTVASYPIEILQTPGQITIVTEAFSEVRRVHLEQPQMPIDEVPPGYYGHSVGKWDGDTLVVDTVGIKESVPSYNMLPHSDRMRITERLRLVTPDVLHDQITIDDPVVLEKPFTYTLAYRRLPNYKMVEFVCENNREYIDEQGRVRMKVGGQK